MALKIGGVTVVDNNRDADFNTISIGGTPLTVTATQFNYLSNVTSDIQTQLDAKQALDANLTSFLTVFTLPTSDSTAGNLLSTDGSGNLTLVEPPQSGTSLARTFHLATA